MADMMVVMLPPAPVLITDKSAIESLSPEEARFLYKHLFINIPQILLNEILADLSKGIDNDLIRVIALANKTRDIDSVINMYYKRLCHESLLGSNIVMDGRVILSNPSKTVHTKEGTGILIDESTEERNRFRWQLGDFSDEEKQAAKVWREQTRNYDLSLYTKGFEKLGVKIPRVKSCSEIPEATEALLGDLSLQNSFLSWLLLMLNRAPRSSQEAIVERWKRSDERYIKGFAPYAHYYLKVYLTFLIGLESNVFSPKSTNRLDLEYCFYLPFCQAFTSKDKFLIKIAPLLLEPFQDFVDPLELKADLNRLAKEWDSLPQEERKERSVHYGKRPQVNKESVVSRLWEKHMAPHKPFSGNILSVMPKEEVARMSDYLMKLTKEIEEFERDPNE